MVVRCRSATGNSCRSSEFQPSPFLWAVDYPAASFKGTFPGVALRRDGPRHPLHWEVSPPASQV
jgi:hypothetical protein